MDHRKLILDRLNFRDAIRNLAFSLSSLFLKLLAQRDDHGQAIIKLIFFPILKHFTLSKI
jgi:hypothetical protein